MQLLAQGTTQNDETEMPEFTAITLPVADCEETRSFCQKIAATRLSVAEQ
jgi:hypothetical protein